MKLKIVSILIVVMILIIQLPAFADVLIPEKPEDAYEYWVVMERFENEILFVSSPEPITVTKDETSIKTIGNKHYKLVDGEWKYMGSWPIGSGSYYTLTTIYKANHDIYYDDGSGVFFFSTEDNPSPSNGPTPAPDPDEPPDSWFDTIRDWVDNILGGVFEGLAVPFEGIANGIKALKDTIVNILDFERLFVPRPDFISNVVTFTKDKIEENIPFLNDVIYISVGLVNSIRGIEVNEPPKFLINLPQKYGGKSVEIIDFTYFTQYRSYIIGFIRAIAWFFFIRKIIRKLPEVVY